MNVKDIRSTLEQRKGSLLEITSNIESTASKIKQLKKEERAHEKAREIIRTVALATQEQLSYNISEISSLALEAVLNNPYELELEFIERRGKTECDIWFVRDGTSIEPFEGGGGAVDIASFALRVASWSMQNPRTRNVLILDEPFKHLKGEQANRRMLEMVKEVSDRLGLQIIMVSDERISREATMEVTDKLFETTIKKGITKVIEL